MAKKKKKVAVKSLDEVPAWSVCEVRGYTVACDPGCNTITPYPKDYTPKQLRKGMNLSEHCSYLPKVKVATFGENFVEVHCGFTKKVLYTGDYFQSPRQPLDYAYSEVEIWLK